MTQPTWNRGTWLWVGAAVALFVFLGGISPEADRPAFLPGLFKHPTTEWGQIQSREMLVEGPGKAHEARNYGLFGEFVRNPADNYQFWRVQAPCWVYPLAWTFRYFGVSYTTLRWFSVSVSLIGLFGFLVLGRRLLPAWATIVGALLLASNLYTSYFARSGLIEVMLVSAAVWITVCLIRAKEHPRWCVAAQAIFVAGFFAKQGMAYMLPMLVLCNVLAFRHWIREGVFPDLRWLPVGTAMTFAAVSAWYMMQPDYVDKVLWNYNHIIGGGRAQRPWTDRFDLIRLWWSAMVLVPGVGIFGLPGALWLSWQAFRRRLSWQEMVVLGWFFSTWTAVFMVEFWSVRISFILLFPTYFVAAMMMARLWTSRRGQWATFAVVGLALTLNIGFQTQRLFSFEYSVRDAAASVREAIGDRSAVLVGVYVMPILFATPYDLYYVKERFNTDPKNLRALGVTHFFGADAYIRYFLVRAGYRVSRPVKAITVTGRRLELRKVELPD